MPGMGMIGAIAGGVSGFNEAGNMLINLQLNKNRLLQNQAEMRQRQTEHADLLRQKELDRVDQTPITELNVLKLKESRNNIALLEEQKAAYNKPIDPNEFAKNIGVTSDVLRNFMQVTGINAQLDATGKFKAGLALEAWKGFLEHPKAIDAIFAEPINRLKTANRLQQGRITAYIKKNYKDIINIPDDSLEQEKEFKNIIGTYANPQSDPNLYKLIMDNSVTHGELKRNEQVYRGLHEEREIANRKNLPLSAREFEYSENLTENEKAKFEKFATKPQTTINLGTSKKFLEELGKTTAESFTKQRENAQLSAQTIQNIKEAKKNLDAGMYTGAGGNIKLGLEQRVNRAGFNIGGEKAANTEAFAASTGKLVGKIIKDFGSGTGLSDADREYAEKIAGGDIRLTKQSMTKLFDIAEKGQRIQIKAYNAIASQIESRYGKEEMPFDMKIQEPEEATARPSLDDIFRGQ